MAKQPTIPINVVDKSIAEDDHKLIAINNEPNPVVGYQVNEEQLRQLIQLPQYWITDENGNTISGVNFYDYFPRGGRSAVIIDKTVNDNGVYKASDDGADGYGTVTVEVSGGGSTLIEKTITEDGVYNPSDDGADGYSLVTVTRKSSVPADVTFYDYDGSVVASYTSEEFAELTELPTNPSHEGLTSQGWNWSLADAKEYVAAYGKLNIGQMYVTDDGKTRIYITLTEGRISPILQLYLNDNSELDIDWGDGSTHSTFTSTSAGYQSERHNYSTPGDYVIAISVTTGSFILQSSSTGVSSTLWNGNNLPSSPDRAYNNSVKKVEIGTGITSIGNYAFTSCFSLTFITIPDGVVSIGQFALTACKSLSSITIPDGVTSIGNFAFDGCRLLQSITIPDSVTSISVDTFSNCSSLTSITIPDGVTSIGNYAFQNCYSLSSITIPDSVTDIGQYAFQTCYSLTSITIPDSFNSIGQYAFYGCYSLQSITIPDTVTIINQYAFYNCSLSSITIPDSVKSIYGNAFQYCSSLTSINIPDSVTIISQYAFSGCSELSSVTIGSGVTSIGPYAFQTCYSLSSVTIGSGVTSIGSRTFYDCKYMESIRFKPTTPPTVSSIDAWQNIPTSCIIYVPQGSLSAYTSATNYPNPNNYTYIEY